MFGGRRARNLRELVEFLLQAAVQRFQIHARFQKDRGSEPTFLLDQREQKMLDVHLLLAASDRLRLRGLDALLELFCKAVEVHSLVDL